MKNQWLYGVLLTVGMAALVSSCSRVQEPWIPSNSYLKEERTRSMEQQQQLRERALYNMIDRTRGRELNRTS